MSSSYSPGEIIRGDDLLVYVTSGGTETLIGGQDSCDFELKQAMIDANHKGSGRGDVKQSVGYSGTLSCDGLIVKGDSSLLGLADTIVNGTLVVCKFAVDDKPITANFWVDSWKKTGKTRDTSKYSCQFSSQGEISIPTGNI